MTFRSIVLMALAALLASCEPPPVKPSADVRQQTAAGLIEGRVVVQSAARGNVVVFLYDADREPPPRSNARPLTFALIPKDVMFAGALEGQTGPFTAPFTFSLVSRGRYKIRAVLDRDACAAQLVDCRGPDLVPWYGVTAEPNKGDIGGGAVDPVTRAFNTYEVTEAEDGTYTTVTGAVVLISDAATVPADRPAFFVSQSESPGGGVRRLTLKLRPVNEGAVDQRQPVFLVRWADDDGNGVPDDVNADGIPEVYPRIAVRKLADAVASGLLDENDLDRNGVLDTTGVDYPRADGTSDGKPDQVMLVAGVDPTPFLAALTDPSTGAPNFTPVPATELSVVIRPIAVDVASANAPLQSVPDGRYSVTVVQFTGQTWRLPNELQPAVAPGVGLPTVDGQDFTLSLP